MEKLKDCGRIWASIAAINNVLYPERSEDEGRGLEKDKADLILKVKFLLMDWLHVPSDK